MNQFEDTRELSGADWEAAYHRNVELNRAIAQANGYRAVEYDCNDRRGWNILDRYGRSGGLCADSEYQAWAMGYPNYHDQIKELIKWSLTMGFRLRIDVTPEYKFMATVGIQTSSFQGQSDTPDYAVFLAFEGVRNMAIDGVKADQS